MGNNIKQIFSFVKEFPPITTGLLLLDDGIIITGHYNGFVVKWEINSGKYEILHDCSEKVETISKSPSKQILVGCRSGLIFYFDISNPKTRIPIQEPEYSKFSRVWRSVWSTADSFLTTSTYGGLSLFYNTDSKWKHISLRGHNHSIFGIGNKNGKYFASGDYNGKIIIWKKTDTGYDSISELRIQNIVEDIVWIKDESFATIDRSGHVNVVELDPRLNTCKIVVSVDVATSEGVCIHVTGDGKTVFAGTSTEIIQYDVDSQQTLTHELENIQKIFSKNNEIQVLTKSGLFIFERHPIETPLDLIKYQYSKVSLIGHTGVGKSTLCSKITNSSDNVKSTFGKKIWTLTLPKKDGPEKRIFFHDYGGQETVLNTFLPFFSDSNIVLVFFAQKDNSTFKKALKIINELKSTLSSKSKIFLVQTYIDEDIDEIDEKSITQLIESGKVSKLFKISPKTKEGIEEFLEQLIDEIDWNTSKTMALSKYVEGLTTTLTDLSSNGGTVVDVNSIKKYFEEHNDLIISTSHLDFLLSNFNSQGLVEYYPDILKSVIFHHDEYNKLRTKIPIFATQNNGIFSMNEVKNKFTNSSYLQILDSVFLKFSIAIQDKDIRIFPSKLKTDGIQIPSIYQTFLDTPIYQKKFNFSIQKIELYFLIQSLIDLKLHCVDASKYDGLFTWETNACVYYHITEEGNAITGKVLSVSYVIGGKDRKIYDRLNKEFSSIVCRLFGPELPNKELPPSK